MIRRGFWLTVGAVTGIYGYRRVSALGRRLSASLNPTGPTQSARLTRPTQSAILAQGARQTSRTAIRAARETYRFTRDVREGMDLYTARHSEPSDPTLNPRPKDGQ